MLELGLDLMLFVVEVGEERFCLSYQLILLFSLLPLAAGFSLE